MAKKQSKKSVKIKSTPKKGGNKQLRGTTIPPRPRKKTKPKK